MSKSIQKNTFTALAHEYYRLLNSSGGVSISNLNSVINNGLETLSLDFSKFKNLKIKNYEKGWYNILGSNKVGRLREHEAEILSNILYQYMSSDYPNILEELEELNVITEKTKEQPSAEIENDENLDEKIIFNLTKFQDIILPYIYRLTYKRDLKNIEFNIDRDWNEITHAFRYNDIHIALHSYSTALALSRKLDGQPSMFFYPLFNFKGYGAFVKKEIINKFCQKKEIPVTTFKKLDPDFKKEFLENTRTVFEPKTDVEWIFKNYCEKYFATWDTVKRNAIKIDINDGKQEFITNKGAGIYFTNSIHIIDLSKQEKKYEFVEGAEFTHHQNPNGLLCTMDYFLKNPKKVSLIIKNWFFHINEFLNEKNAIVTNPTGDIWENGHLKGLLNSLNQYTNSNLSLPELMKSYTVSNVFYLNENEALAHFYTKNFIKEQFDKSFNWDISNIQLGKNDNDNKMEIIKKQYDDMQSALKKIKY